MQFWKIALLGGGFTLAGWLGWSYSSEQTATLVAVHTQTGQLAWLHPLPDGISHFSHVPIAADGKVLVGFHRLKLVVPGTWAPSYYIQADYQLQALNAKSGQLLWQTRPTGPKRLDVHPSLVFEGNQLYLQVDNQLRSLDPATGQQRWAVERPWTDIYFSRPSLGLVALSQHVLVSSRSLREGNLQFVDPMTGKVQRQIKVSLGKRFSKFDLIGADDRQIIQETLKEEIPTDSNTFERPYNWRSIVTAFDLKTGQSRWQKEIIQSGWGSNFQLGQGGVLIRQDPPQSALLAIDSETGLVRWRKPYQQLSCPKDQLPGLVDADFIFLSCTRRMGMGNPSPTTIVAVSTQTGQVKWQTEISPDPDETILPSAASAKQFLTFRQVIQGKYLQTQAIALDRQTGKLLWSFPLDRDRFVKPYDSEVYPFINRYQAVVATEGDRFFFLDLVPRWKIWRWQFNSALSTLPDQS